MQNLLVLKATCSRHHRSVEELIENDRKKENLAFGFLEVAAKSLTDKNDCSIFGEMVAAQLRKLSSRNQTIARNMIQNLIFDLEIKKKIFFLRTKHQCPILQLLSRIFLWFPLQTNHYYITQPQSSGGGGDTIQPGNVFGEIQQFLCFNLDSNKLRKVL